MILLLLVACNFIGEEEIAEILYTPSLITLLRIFTGFKLILSKEKIAIETIIKTKRENFCLAPLCNRAERIAIPKSSRLVGMV